MRAVEYDQFGTVDVLQVRDVTMPVVGAGEVLVAVAACSVNPKDVFLRKGRFVAVAGAMFPARPGFDYAGTVAAVGDGVTAFEPGERVWGMVNGWAGGACAEYIAVRADELALMPKCLSFKEAAAVPLAALTALQALRNAGGMRGEGCRVVVNGAAGGVGLFALQIARIMGAHVTAIASAGNETLCRAHGAEAFVQRGTALEQIAGTDLLFDAFGALIFDEVRELLADDGILVSTVPSPTLLMAQAATSGVSGKRARLVVVNGNAVDLEWLAGWMIHGRLKAHIDAVYPLDEVRAAHSHVETKRTRGKVVIQIAASDASA